MAASNGSLCTTWRLEDSLPVSEALRPIGAWLNELLAAMGLADVRGAPRTSRRKVRNARCGCNCCQACTATGSWLSRFLTTCWAVRRASEGTM